MRLNASEGERCKVVLGVEVEKKLKEGAVLCFRCLIRKCWELLRKPPDDVQAGMGATLGTLRFNVQGTVQYLALVCFILRGTRCAYW